VTFFEATPIPTSFLLVCLLAVAAPNPDSETVSETIKGAMGSSSRTAEAHPAP